MSFYNRAPGTIFNICIGLAIFLFVSCSSKEPGYFVSKNGDDNNPGTREKPFQTIEKLNTLKLSPGDKIFLRSGDEFTGTLRLILDGKQDSSIVISSYGDSSAIINGGNRQAIIINGNHFELRNIHVKGSGRKEGNTTNGIQITGSSNGIIENIRTEGFQKSGLEVF